jgi:hypothetical protein
VFNTVNLHVYHYAGNNPVKCIDPDGRADVDWENKVILADMTLEDLSRATDILYDINDHEFKIVATDEKSRQLIFTDYNTALKFVIDVAKIQDTSGINWDLVKKGVIDLLFGGVTMAVTGTAIGGSKGTASPLLAGAFIEGLLNAGWGVIEIAEGLTGREQLPSSLDLFVVYVTRGFALKDPELRERWKK